MQLIKSYRSNLVCFRNSDGENTYCGYGLEIRIKKQYYPTENKEYDGPPMMHSEVLSLINCTTHMDRFIRNALYRD